MLAQLLYITHKGRQVMLSLTSETFQADTGSYSRVTRETHLENNDLEGSGGKSAMKSEEPGLGETANCDFGVGTDVNMCRWSNLNMSAFHWVSSSGVDSYWIGGPQIDDNEKNKQGAVLFIFSSGNNESRLLSRSKTKKIYFHCILLEITIKFWFIL